MEVDSDGDCQMIEDGPDYAAASRPPCTIPSGSVIGASHAVNADVGAVDGVPEVWRALSPYELRHGQVETLEALAKGCDVLSRQPTGSGKSLVAYLPAIAQWTAGAREMCARGGTSGLLPPVTLMVVPWRALGFDQEREANSYFRWLYETGRTSTCPQAFFVNRSRDSTRGATSGTGAAAASGHVPPAAPSASGEAVVPSVAVAAAAAEDVLPCCRGWWPDERDTKWCAWCKKPSNQGGKRVSGCVKARERRSVAVAVASSAGDGAAKGRRLWSTTRDASRSLRPERLPASAPERLLEEDPLLALLIVTPDTLESDSEKGSLLRRRLRTRLRLGRDQRGTRVPADQPP